MKVKRIYASDFETTVYDGQQRTDVWLCGSARLFSDETVVFGCIETLFDYYISLQENLISYFHNLKFDGSFWLDFFIRKLNLKQAYKRIRTGNTETIVWLENKDMPLNSFKYSISSKGQWYTITIKTAYGKTIEIWDSLKLLPFSLAEIGKAFKTNHQKTTMEYEGYRYPNCPVKSDELEYFHNDLYVLKESLETAYLQGHSKLTIGSCCMAEFKKTYDKEDYKHFFPNIYETEAPEYTGIPSAGEYIHKSYRGAWTYLVPEKAGKIFHKGLTADVNSLYPSVMHSVSGNYYPVGQPKFWRGNIPEEAIADNRYYFIRIRTKFYLKPGYLPTIQIKGNFLYPPTKFLETSDIYDRETGEYFDRFENEDGEIEEVKVTLTLTKDDYELIQGHYDLVDCEVLDGCWFYAEIGLFDEYIDKYKEIKMHSKGAERTLAKLFLNNLYGKLATYIDSSFKVAYLDGEEIKFQTVFEQNQIPGYIPCGSVVTAKARRFTIEHAQANYHGPDQPGFIYADTDSLHMDLQPEESQGLNIHPSDFLCWKLESYWDEALFVRSKTYIEHVTHEDGEPVEKPYYSITCAGLPEYCKKLMLWSINQDYTEKDIEKLTETEKEFIKKKRDITDFKVGIVIPGKLRPKRIPGGIVLEKSDYTMR